MEYKYPFRTVCSTGSTLWPFSGYLESVRLIPVIRYLDDIWVGNDQARARVFGLNEAVPQVIDTLNEDGFELMD